MSSNKKLLKHFHFFYRHYRTSAFLAGLFLLLCTFYYHLLPLAIGKYYLPGLWEFYKIGHLECKVRSFSFSKIELQDIYFWDDFGREGSVNRGTIEYKFTPWGLKSLLNIKSVNFSGLHASASYFGGKIRLHGADLAKLAGLNKYIHFETNRSSESFQCFALKNSHVDFFFFTHRLHLPFTLKYTYVPSRNLYQMFGYIAPRGEYSIISSQFFPEEKKLKINLKNENINLGCFNDFLPENFNRNNRSGRLAASLLFNLEEKQMKEMNLEAMTGLPDNSAPNCTLAFNYKSDSSKSGRLNFQGKLRRTEGIYTAAGKDLNISLSYPFLNCEGTVHTELYPIGENLSNLILPASFASDSQCQGQFSLVNYKWTLKTEGTLEDGLTAMHQTFGRFGCSSILYRTIMTGQAAGSPVMEGLINIPRCFLQNQGKDWEFNRIRLNLRKQPQKALSLSLQGGNLSFRSSTYHLKADSCSSEGVIFSPRHDLDLQGNLSNLKQRYQGHEIICPTLCYAFRKYPGDSTVHLNINSHKASMQSSLHGYFTDCLQLNWNWLFNPSADAVSSSDNYLRCQCLRLPRNQTARLELQFQQQNTTACWNGQIYLQSPEKDQTINLNANMHWPLWKQLPFMAVHVDMPKHILNDLPFLQSIFPGSLYTPEQDENSIITLWLNGGWFNGKLRTRSGYSSKGGSVQQSSLPPRQ